MRERKVVKTQRIKEQEELLRIRLSLRDQLGEALRLCHGKIDQETLLKICPTVKIDGAIEIGLLVVQKNSKGKMYFMAGPNLHDENCDLMKALNINAMVAQCAAS